MRARFSSIAALATASIGSAIAAMAAAATDAVTTPRHLGRTVYPNGWRQFQRGHRVRPHQGPREIARRLRQAEKLRMKYMLNGGFSRRGREVGPV